MQADEVRYKEDMPALGLNWIRLGLDDVLYDPKTKTIYTPNTNASVKVGEGGIAVGDEENRFSPDQPRDEHGRFTFGSGGGSSGKGVDKSKESDIIDTDNNSLVPIRDDGYTYFPEYRLDMNGEKFDNLTLKLPNNEYREVMEGINLRYEKRYKGIPYCKYDNGIKVYHFENRGYQDVNIYDVEDSPYE